MVFGNLMPLGLIFECSFHYSTLYTWRPPLVVATTNHVLAPPSGPHPHRTRYANRLNPRNNRSMRIVPLPSGPIFTKKAHNVAKMVPFHICKLELRHSNPLRNASISHILPKIGCHGNVTKRIRRSPGRKIHANAFHLVKRS